MRTIILLILLCSLLTSCVVVRGKDGAPGKPGTSGVNTINKK